MKNKTKGYLLARHKTKPVACCFDLEWLMRKPKWKQDKILKDWEVIYVCPQLRLFQVLCFGLLFV